MYQFALYKFCWYILFVLKICVECVIMYGRKYIYAPICKEVHLKTYQQGKLKWSYKHIYVNKMFNLK